MTANKLLKTTAFYALVVVIVVFSVFPFYYAIVTIGVIIASIGTKQRELQRQRDEHVAARGAIA